MIVTGKHLIAGAWVLGDMTFASDPATGAARNYSVGTPAHVNNAVVAAEAAFWSYSALPRAARAAFLDRIADEIKARGAQITGIGTSETGLSAARLEGERGRTTGQLRLFAAHIRTGDYLDRRHDPALPGRQPLPRPDIRLIQAVGFTGSLAGGRALFDLSARRPDLHAAHGCGRHRSCPHADAGPGPQGRSRAGQRLSDGCRGLRCDGAWRPLSGQYEFWRDQRGHNVDPPLVAPRQLSEHPRSAFARRFAMILPFHRGSTGFPSMAPLWRRMRSPGLQTVVAHRRGKPLFARHPACTSMVHFADVLINPFPPVDYPDGLPHYP